MIHFFHKWEVVDFKTKLCSVCDMIKIEHVWVSNGEYIVQGLIGKKFAKTQSLFDGYLLWERRLRNEAVFSKFIRLAEDYKETKKIIQARISWLCENDGLIPARKIR